eukprot:655546-Prymnesium_polylepis.1
MAMLRGLSGALTRAFISWLAWADEAAEMLGRVRAALISLQAATRRAFNSWLDGAGMSSNAKRAMAHMANARLSKGWEGWCECVRLNALRRRAVTHFVGAGLVRVLNSWEAFLEGRREHAAAAARLLLHKEGAALR